MTTHTHQTAPTQFVEANGIRFAYRRFGKPRGVPIVLNQHFRGTMDYWDPAVTDGLAQTREVILFDNAGIASSSGEVPPSIPKMGVNAIAFIRALGLSRSICWAFPSAAWSRRRSPCRPPIWYAS
jgi:pimeloyl-ACP methyl ester carboxylesterase